MKLVWPNARKRHAKASDSPKTWIQAERLTMKFKGEGCGAPPPPTNLHRKGASAPSAGTMDDDDDDGNDDHSLILPGYQLKKKELDRTFSIHGGCRKCIQNFNRKPK